MMLWIIVLCVSIALLMVGAGVFIVGHTQPSEKGSLPRISAKVATAGIVAAGVFLCTGLYSSLEVYSHAQVNDAVHDTVKQTFGVDTPVSVSNIFLVPSLVGQHIGELRVASDTFTGDFHDVQLQGTRATNIGSVSGSILYREKDLLARINSSNAGVASNVAFLPEGNTLVISGESTLLGTSIPYKVAAAVSTTGGRLELTASRREDSDISGLKLPDIGVDVVLQAYSKTVNDSIPEGAAISKAEVTPAGLHIYFAGKNVKPSS